ncbi:topoisomerase C-terminal repeat-containing protein [Alicyclobacillus fastidiosus]|uniref:topoisomerase C-terminal repeat-containing protein n=1 Tax=Alicyclobacillus fastidiosus TaxID=392011 RepID=UPI0023E98543|nr:topoisomerase C-terminal repeat-containing protein [Alicyclobacillus fastidiosus]GMA65974.1 hypothetical protein GCM10025859_64160 [Alicyclobacillus fastidiosus]GMA66194.1 hypothetical protein GCM10025859_66360 [Alicyclobacillus fastidiosus]
MEQLLNDFTSPDATKQYLQDIHRLIAGNIQYCTEMKPEDRVLPKIDASCPVCHEDLMEAGFRYQCTLSTCDFALPKQYAGHTLKVSEIQALSTHRETGVLTFTKKDSNKKYNAKLRLNDANRLELAFPAPEETQLGYCPKCRKGRVYVKNPSVCVCTECDFVVYRTIAQKALTDKRIQTLLRSGSIPVIKGFKKKDQSTFAAGLKFKDDFKLEFTRPS